MEECRKIVARQGGCKTGEVVITPAGNLSCRFVIHTVGPVWNGGEKGEAEKLRSCYWNSLSLAVENGCRTIAFPGISTGVYRYPKNLAAEIAVKTVCEFLEKNEFIEKVFFVCFEQEYEEEIRKWV